MDVQGTYFGRTGYVPRGWGLSPGGDCRVATIITNAVPDNNLQDIPFHWMCNFRTKRKIRELITKPRSHNNEIGKAITLKSQDQRQLSYFHINYG